MNCRRYDDDAGADCVAGMSGLHLELLCVTLILVERLGPDVRCTALASSLVAIDCLAL